MRKSRRYKKKPVVIEAMQYTAFNFSEVEEFIGEKLVWELESETAYVAGKAPPRFSLIIPTLEGKMKATQGDYIIKGIEGEFYPCKQDIFSQTYSEYCPTERQVSDFPSAHIQPLRKWPREDDTNVKEAT
jgi:hypothetical protein